MKDSIQHGGNVAEEFHMELLSTHKMNHNFNTLSVGKPFRYSSLCLITGGDDGTIRVYAANKENRTQNFQEVSKLESKGGPVQCLQLHNVTKFGSKDLIVGDSKGTLTIFSSEQILTRRFLSHGSITALSVDEDFAGNLAIVVGDDEGTVTAVSPYGSLWKIRLQDAYKQELGLSTSVKCMLSVKLAASNGLSTNYLLVADNCKNLFVLQNGMVVFRLHVTSVVTAMTPGYFIPIIPQLSSPSQSFGSPRQQSVTSSRQPQVAMGTEEGSIYIFSNFQLQPYASVQLPVTHLATFQLNTQTDATDILLCAGHFNALMVFQRQELIKRLYTKEWLHTVSCTNINNERHIIIGMLDNTVMTFKVTKPDRSMLNVMFTT